MNELIALALRRAGVGTLAEFQALQGLPQTGIDDPETRAALEPYLLGYRTVQLQPGETFWTLAERYGATTQAIATANPTLDPDRLTVGETVRIPLNFPVVPTDVPMTSDLCSLCIRGIVGRYPFCEMETLTTTAFGRPVEALQLGTGPRRVLYTAAHHANEWITATLLLAFAAINLKADQTIGGTALNLFAPAFCVVVAWAVQGQGITDIAIPSWTRWTPEQLHIAGKVNQDFLPSLFKKFYITIPIALVLFLIAWFVLYKTRFGLRMRACGEHPQAADSVGINVYKMRYAGVMISGFLGGIGGLAYVLVTGTSFAADVGGYGFLALAVMIFGNWKPLQIFFCSIFFALFKVVGTYYTLIPILPNFKGVEKVSNIYNLLPYVVTMIVLIATSKSSQAPKAEGIPYDKGSR